MSVILLTVVFFSLEILPLEVTSLFAVAVLVLFNVIDIGFNSLFLKANKDLIILLNKFNLNSSKIKNYVKITERNILKFFDKKKVFFFST